MKVAVIQMNSKAHKQQNIAKALRLVKKALNNKAEFILLPEVFNFRGQLKKKNALSSITENIPGESTKPFLELAKKNKIYILIGSICEKVKGSTKAYNTSVLINRQGRIQAKYRKRKLFDANLGDKSIRESLLFSAGKSAKMTSVGPFRLGMSICYDLRFPELYREYAKRGATVISVPSSFTRPTGKAHWKALLRARAIENLCYVLAPNQIGKDSQKVDSYGHSMIISPWGEVLAKASGNKEEIIYSTLKMSDLRRDRSRLPGVF